MEPRFFFWLEMGGIHTSHIPAHHASPTWGTTSISHSNTPHYPISPHIDEDALEVVYFAF